MAQDLKQTKIETELERQQQDALRALKTYITNIQYYLQECNDDSTNLTILGKLIKQFENGANTTKEIITRHFAQRVVKNAYRKKERG